MWHSPCHVDPPLRSHQTKDVTFSNWKRPLSPSNVNNDICNILINFSSPSTGWLNDRHLHFPSLHSARSEKVKFHCCCWRRVQLEFLTTAQLHFSRVFTSKAASFVLLAEKSGSDRGKKCVSAVERRWVLRIATTPKLSGRSRKGYFPDCNGTFPLSIVTVPTVCACLCAGADKKPSRIHSLLNHILPDPLLFGGEIMTHEKFVWRQKIFNSMK